MTEYVFNQTFNKLNLNTSYTTKILKCGDILNLDAFFFVQTYYNVNAKPVYIVYLIALIFHRR